jgi:hypothetical protein
MSSQLSPARERLVGRYHGGDAEDVRIDAVHARGDDARQWRTADPLTRLLVAHQQHRRAVTQRRAVAGGHRAAGDERRLQRGEPLERSVGSNALVARQLDAGQRHDLGRYAVLVGARRQLVAAAREGVLLVARDVVHAGQQRGHPRDIAVSSPA